MLHIRVNSRRLGRCLEAADIADLKPTDLHRLRLELNETLESLDFQENKARKAENAGGPKIEANWLKRVGVKRRVTRLALVCINQAIDDRQRQAIAAAERQLAQVLLRHGLPTDPHKLDKHLAASCQGKARTLGVIVS